MSRNNQSDPEAFRQDLMNIAKTTLSSKILTGDKEKFAKIAVDAVLRLKGSTNLEHIQVRPSPAAATNTPPPPPGPPRPAAPGGRRLGPTGAPASREPYFRPEAPPRAPRLRLPFPPAATGAQPSPPPPEPYPSLPAFSPVSVRSSRRLAAASRTATWMRGSS